MALHHSIGQRWTSRFRSLVTLGALLASVTAALVGGSPRAALAAEPILWGAYVSGAPWDAAKLDEFERNAGRKQSIVAWGQPWITNGKYQPFQTPQFQMVRDRGQIPMLHWGSWDYSKGTDQPEFRLAAIANGDHDAHIRKWAQSAAAWGHPFFLRFNHEMNGWWQFPWAEQTNGNKPGDFVRAWRHVHDIFTQEGATNATWVWCPNISGPRTTPLPSLYPGDEYVDWTCMDGYNWGTDLGNEWQSFEEVFGGSAYNGYRDTYQELVDLAPSKPIMIGETATSVDGGDPAAWILDGLTNRLPTRFPQVQALVWFNWDAGDPRLDWQIERSQQVRSAFAQAIGSGYYASNDFANLPRQRIGAPSSSASLASSQPGDS